MGMGKYLRQRTASFGYAFKGVATLLRTQAHAQVHLVATLVVVVAGLLCDLNRGEWIPLVLCMGLVWMAEAMNTAVEFLTDLASPEFHPLAGKAKDVAAGAVLLAAICAAVVASFVFWPHLFG